MLFPATAPSSTTCSLSCYTTRLLGFLKTDAKQRLRSEHFFFLDELTAKVFTWYQEEARRRTAILFVFEEHLGVRFHAEKIHYTDFM
jgi:hypothetical protein